MTHHPTWMDTQQLFMTLFTMEERDHIQREAQRETAEGISHQVTERDLNDVFPLEIETTKLTRVGNIYTTTTSVSWEASKLNLWWFFWRHS